MNVTNIEIKEFIDQKFPLSEPARKHYFDMWIEYEKTQLADSHFIGELICGDDGKFWSRIWEMKLALRLKVNGHELFSDNEGPDLKLTYNNKTIWIEAITPEPVGICKDWLNYMHVGSPPFDEMILRWTASIKEKKEKLDKYIQNKIVESNHAYIIAIDPCRLNPRQDEGLSQLPVVIETVFPVSALAIDFNRSTGLTSAPYRTYRENIKNRNNSNVATDNFLNPNYASVSAIIAPSPYFVPVEKINMIVVHNPLATVKLEPGLFGTNSIDYVANKISAVEFELKPISN